MVLLDRFEASERGRFCPAVICPRLSLLTHQLSNFLLDSCRQMFDAELLDCVGRMFLDVSKLK